MGGFSTRTKSQKSSQRRVYQHPNSIYCNSASQNYDINERAGLYLSGGTFVQGVRSPEERAGTQAHAKIHSHTFALSHNHAHKHTRCQSVCLSFTFSLSLTDTHTGTPTHTHQTNLLRQLAFCRFGCCSISDPHLKITSSRREESNHRTTVLEASRRF